jgi:hypothetical protein
MSNNKDDHQLVEELVKLKKEWENEKEKAHERELEQKTKAEKDKRVKRQIIIDEILQLVDQFAGWMENYDPHSYRLMNPTEEVDMLMMLERNEKTDKRVLFVWKMNGWRASHCHTKFVHWLNGNEAPTTIGFHTMYVDDINLRELTDLTDTELEQVLYLLYHV